MRKVGADSGSIFWHARPRQHNGNKLQRPQKKVQKADPKSAPPICKMKPKIVRQKFPPVENCRAICLEQRDLGAQLSHVRVFT